MLALLDLVVAEAAAPGLEPGSFRGFYEDALPRIYGYFLHRCGGSAAVAEELTQETFVAAVAELRKGRRVESPVPWIYGIARHKLLDHYRRERRGRDAPAAADAGELHLPDDSEETRERVVAALAAVAPSQRAALVLCYVDGFSAEEAAALLDRTTAAVHSLLERGRASFKRAYLEAAP
jgi:RNA polymerase sigma-70 factor (ECF subfamily)